MTFLVPAAHFACCSTDDFSATLSTHLCTQLSRKVGDCPQIYKCGMVSPYHRDSRRMCFELIREFSSSCLRPLNIRTFKTKKECLKEFIAYLFFCV